MEFFADGPDGEKVQNVRFLNNESNAGAFHSGNKQFRTGHFHSQGHRRRQGRRAHNRLLPAGFVLEAVLLQVSCP